VAEDFSRDLTHQLYKLAHTALTGTSREWISSGLRAFPYKGYCFYFRIIDDRMYIVRVLHGHQDVNAQNFGEETKR